MKIIKNLTKIPDLSLALGFFDGVHLGHQRVLSSAVNFAKENMLKSAIVTFKEHPLCYLKNIKPELITQKQQNYKILKELGLDYIIELDFKNFYSMNAENYLADILVSYFSPMAISTGFNHYFGANKSGNVNFLASMQNKYNYKYFEIPPQKFNDKIISSSVIRNSIKTGNVDIASKMLGRAFSIQAIVEHGKQLGRTIGFPTANTVFPENIVQPPYGVYSVNIIIENVTYKGIANFGIKPTISDCNKPVLETHILNFEGNLYGKQIKVEFLKMLRHEIKFDSINELKKQINLDIKSIL